ncbi:hypothetical protein AZH53_03920 [Methanomicrobiaceae archaeon CYW5]|nr:hypothetical protein [Methanovulcanius yangii]
MKSVLLVLFFALVFLWMCDGGFAGAPLTPAMVGYVPVIGVRSVIQSVVCRSFPLWYAIAEEGLECGARERTLEGTGLSSPVAPWLMSSAVVRQVPPDASLEKNS